MIVRHFICAQSDNERAEFRSLLLKSKGKDALIYKLYKLVLDKEDISKSELIKILYPQGGDNTTFNKLCSRLSNEMVTWKTNKTLLSDKITPVTIMSTLEVAKSLRDNCHYEAAKHFYDKAEKHARLTGNKLLLEMIYMDMLDCPEVMGWQVPVLIKKTAFNMLDHLGRKRLRMMKSRIKASIEKAKRSDNDGGLDPEKMLDDVLKELDIKQEEANDPLFLHEAVTLLRTAITPGKNYQKFERFVSKIYGRLSKAEKFTKAHTEIELDFMQMLAHSLYRNRKFDDALTLLELFKAKLPEELSRTSVLYHRYVLIKAACFCFSGRLDEAIATLTKALKGKENMNDLPEIMNMRLNLVVYYFYAKRFDDAIEMLNSFGFTDDELEQKMGKEFRFKKNMITVVVYCDRGNSGEAITGLQQISTYYSSFLDRSLYENAKPFIELVEMMFKDPLIVSTEAFRNKVRQSEGLWNGPKDDIQAIAFFVWLKAKMKGCDPYELLMTTFSKMAEIEG